MRPHKIQRSSPSGKTHSYSLKAPELMIKQGLSELHKPRVKIKPSMQAKQRKHERDKSKPPVQA